MLRTDRAVAVVIIGFSIFMFVKSGELIDAGSKAVISAAFFPRFYLISLIVCCSLLLFKSRMKPVNFPSLKKTITAAVLVIVYALLIEPAGYFTVTPIFLLLLPLTMGYRRWGWLAAFALAGTIFSYFVFYKTLGVPLPLGILENFGGLS